LFGIQVDAIARFTAFVAGPFAAVLLLATVTDPNVFIHLEITCRRSVFFYVSVIYGILAVARRMTLEENRLFDLELFIRQLSSTRITFQTNGGNNHTPIQCTRISKSSSL